MTVSVCFPWRSVSVQRDRSADWVERRWNAIFPTFELVRGFCFPGPFNRSQAINDAVRRSQGEILIIADLDVIFDRDSVEEALNRVRANNSDWGFGFTHYIKLTQPFSESVLENPIDVGLHEVDSYEESETTMSGLVIISRMLFESFGGFDENFTGWGYEDLAFAQQADRVSSHFRTAGSAYHLWHESAFDAEHAAMNQEYYQEQYLGLYRPEPTTLPDGDIGVRYPTVQLTAKNRVEPIVWSAVGLPPGLHITSSGVIEGIPECWSVTAVIVSAKDAEGVVVERPYYDMTIHPGVKKTVGLYSAWDEPFEDILERLSWSTPYLKGKGYKSMRFVTPDQPHDYALVFNATDRNIPCSKSNIYVLIFEPPEILGNDNPWLKSGTHPQSGANIYMFGGGSDHKQILGLHIPQATLSDSTFIPSSKPRRCSMICSDKTFTVFHRKRRDIMNALFQTDLDIDFYGRGMEPGNDPRVLGEICSKIKDLALRPYSFTIDFENSARDVLTDKFSDPLLNGTVPITNSTGAQKAFPEGSFEFVNFDESVDQIVERIRQIITQPTLTHYDDPVTQAKDSLSYGGQNIVEWLHRKIEQI